METTKILSLVCAALFVCIVGLIILLLASRKKNKELREELEGTYLIRNADIVVNDHKIKINYAIPYRKRKQAKQDQVNTIRAHLEINNFGEQKFNERMVRDHLRNHDIRNLNILPA